MRINCIPETEKNFYLEQHTHSKLSYIFFNYFYQLVYRVSYVHTSINKNSTEKKIQIPAKSNNIVCILRDIIIIIISVIIIIIIMMEKNSYAVSFLKQKQIFFRVATYFPQQHFCLLVVVC